MHRAKIRAKTRFMGLFLLISVILFFLLLHRRAAAQAEIVGHGGAVPAEHGLHDPDVAVDVHGVGPVQLIQLPLEPRHDAVHGALNFGLGLVQILAADACLLKLGIGVQQLLGGGQIVIQEGAGLGLFGNYGP